MIITCPACTTRYYAGETSLGNRARKVSCAKCGNRWMLEPEAGWAEDEAEADDQAKSFAPEPLSATPAPEMRASPEPEAIDIYASPVRRRGVAWDRIASFLLAIMILVGLVAAAVQYRADLVRAFPVLGGLYARIGLPVNVTGLQIRTKGWEIQSRNGTPLLVVNGEIANTGGQAAVPPKLSLVLRDAHAHELYRWSADAGDRKPLAPGAVTPFTTTLKSPPLDAHDLEIRFLDRT